MLTLNISDADIETARYERFSHPCPLVQKRLHVLFLKATTSFSHQTIAFCSGVCADSVTDYIRFYNDGGLQRIYKVGYGTNRSEIEPFSKSLIDILEENPPHTLAQACQIIEENTGVKRSHGRVYAWMKNHKFRFRKTGHVPAGADTEKQKEFAGNDFQALKESAENGEIHLLFADAAHFVMGVFLCCLWSVKRVFIKSSAGRQRYNVLGAVNAITKEIHTLTNCTYINAECICDFFEKLRGVYSGGRTICIIMDNARYQKCQLVRYVAWQFNIKLVYLPPYSPNLNIIERLWKWTKKKALHAKYYDNFECFKKAIDCAISDANGTDKDEIKTLLSLNFQRF